jgi:hypothetical protein
MSSRVARSRGRIIVAGGVAQRYRRAGHVWVFLQYLLGLRRLGWDVLFLDRLERDMCTDAAGHPCAPRYSVQLAYFARCMDRFGLTDAWALLCEGEGYLGRSRDSVIDHALSSVFLLNFMGYWTDEEVLSAPERRVFVDLDPGFGQMWHQLGLVDLFTGHDAFVTVGTGIGSAGCTIPACGVEWIPTLPPVVLEEWPRVVDPGDGFTTVATWRGDSGSLEFEGHTYGLRAHAFRELLSLPSRTGQQFRVALDIHPNERADLARLSESAWTIQDPLTVAGGPDAYRGFIAGSRAELMVAKALYTETRSGWISDRSACYLASGRPVLASDTGFEAALPSGEGLLSFADLEGAVVGVAQIDADWERHARAARELAEAYLDSDRVLARLLDEMAASLPQGPIDPQGPTSQPPITVGPG